MSILISIRKTLKAKTNRKFATEQENYFKESIKAYGTGVPYARQVAKQYYPQIKHLEFKEILNLSESLLNSGYFEEGIVAFDILNRSKKHLDAKLLHIFEKWIDKYIHNWAHCDELSAHLIGHIIEKNPDSANEIIKWTTSKNRWKRRSASVSLVIPARRGKQLDLILTIADKLKTDSDDMVQKGVGWMLKEASKAHPTKIIRFIRKNKAITPRTMLRYAIEKLPAKTKKALMEK